MLGKYSISEGEEFMEEKSSVKDRKIRKKALIMTAIFTIVMVIIEALVVVITNWIWEVRNNFEVDKISICIGIILMNIVFAILVYFDFKEDISKKEKSKEDTTIR